MANNRMWLRNTRTGDKILLAKFYPSGGWSPYVDGDGLQSFFALNDFTRDQIKANALAISQARNPFAGPHKAASSEANGEHYVLEYE